MRLWYNLEKKSWHLSVKFCCVVFFSFYIFRVVAFLFFRLGFLLFLWLFIFYHCVRSRRAVIKSKAARRIPKAFQKAKKNEVKQKQTKKPYNTPIYITTITTRRGAKIARYCKASARSQSQTCAPFVSKIVKISGYRLKCKGKTLHFPVAWYAWSTGGTMSRAWHYPSDRECVPGNQLHQRRRQRLN